VTGISGIARMNLAGLSAVTLAELREFFVSVHVSGQDSRDAQAWIEAIDAEMDLRGMS